MLLILDEKILFSNEMHNGQEQNQRSP